LCDNDALKLGMFRVEQTVVFTWDQRRGHEEHAVPGVSRELIANPGKLRRSGGSAPVWGKIGDFQAMPADIVGNFRRGEDEIERKLILIEMNEILQHGERLVLGGIGEPGPRTGPAAAVAECAFAVEGSMSVLSAQDAKNARQLIPP
jgi:hypothetical protein